MAEDNEPLIAIPDGRSIMTPEQTRAAEIAGSLTERQARTASSQGLEEALRRIAEMTDVEADFDGFEARSIARDALADLAGKEPQP